MSLNVKTKMKLIIYRCKDPECREKELVKEIEKEK